MCACWRRMRGMCRVCVEFATAGWCLFGKGGGKPCASVVAGCGERHGVDGRGRGVDRIVTCPRAVSAASAL